MGLEPFCRAVCKQHGNGNKISVGGKENCNCNQIAGEANGTKQDAIENISIWGGLKHGRSLKKKKNIRNPEPPHSQCGELTCLIWFNKVDPFDRM